MTFDLTAPPRAHEQHTWGQQQLPQHQAENPTSKRVGFAPPTVLGTALDYDRTWEGPCDVSMDEILELREQRVFPEQNMGPPPMTPTLFRSGGPSHDQNITCDPFSSFSTTPCNNEVDWDACFGPMDGAEDCGMHSEPGAWATAFS
eukprot:CAMPEP_0182465436 /NCGR_PEP_ID=MMETSP1319-20130603/9730_1 /TAXON_ID=172717 /ORGANISM="Bolidomonas pacifica, Strain RCC208" /LENGTH=145 /DNA_ID=CAMNT_0024665185 /DNA_START=11 /DNA_END=444 /DNA_ORIENTATION=+